MLIKNPIVKKMKKVILRFVIFLSVVFFCSSIFAINDKQLNILVLTDIHLDQNSNYQMEIAPSQMLARNDLDEKTFIKSLDVISANLKNNTIQTPEIVFLLGDLVGHDRSKKAQVKGDEAEVFQRIVDLFPKTPVFYVFGNNDSFVKDYGSFSDKSGNTPYEVAKNSGWKGGFLSTGVMCSENRKEKKLPCVITENRALGYYSAYLKPNLRLITLNSVSFVKRNVKKEAENSRKELEWLQTELEMAHANHEYALIAMHVPVGKNVINNAFFWAEKYQTEFLDIISLHKKDIVAILSGHTHMDELEILRDEKNKNQNDILPLFITPGLSTSHGNLPALRTYNFERRGFIDKGNWEFNDYKTYSLFPDGDNLKLQLLYDFKDYYKSFADITAEKMTKYYTAGNPNFSGYIFFPGNIYITTNTSSK